ncbi:MAG: phosphotransferase [Xanthobacteraceae bacterium]|jgi:thiamine kinase-like enzyme|nr:phosphotransferase [Xanthobacteraceae bacterium]
MDAEPAAARVRSLALWRGPVEPVPLKGGITNTNFLVEDAGRRYAVRVGHDIPVHGILRFAELAASRAAHAAGVSPAVIHAEPGVMVLDFIDGRTFAADDVRAELPRVVDLVRRAHRRIPKHLRGPMPMFWVFHVIRDYAATLREGGSPYSPALPSFLATAERLEAAVGAIEIAFGHNDLLPANFLDDGRRLWLVDWDYSGFNTPLFDLGGLASNAGFAEDEEVRLLELYYQRPVDHGLRRRFQAMLTASLMRETMWSMVAEIHSTLDFDYHAYTQENLWRYDAAFVRFTEMGR